MIMQCIDNEVKSTEVTQNSAEDEFNIQSKNRNDTDYGSVNNAFGYADMKETDFGEIWKEKNPEIVSTDFSISAFKVTSFTKCVKHIYSL